MQTITRSIAAPNTNTDTINVIALTCPSCDSHNVSDVTGKGACGDCGLTDNLSGFMGAKMTAAACFKPSRFAKTRTVSDSPRGWTISGNVD